MGLTAQRYIGSRGSQGGAERESTPSTLSAQADLSLTGADQEDSVMRKEALLMSFAMFMALLGLALVPAPSGAG